MPVPRLARLSLALRTLYDVVLYYPREGTWGCRVCVVVGSYRVGSMCMEVRGRLSSLSSGRAQKLRLPR